MTDWKIQIKYNTYTEIIYVTKKRMFSLLNVYNNKDNVDVLFIFSLKKISNSIKDLRSIVITKM